MSSTIRQWLNFLSKEDFSSIAKINDLYKADPDNQEILEESENRLSSEVYKDEVIVEKTQSTLKSKYTNGDTEFAFYRGNGVKTGVYTKFDETMNLIEVGRYRNGALTGPRWRRIPYQAWIITNQTYQSDEKMKNSVFIYPDLSTALVGEFDDDNVATDDLQVGEIVGVEMKEGILTPSLRPSGIKIPCPLSNMTETIIKQPCYRDPYEHRTVEVRESLIPEAGEGLFTTRRVLAGQLIAYFAGKKVLNSETQVNSDYAISLEDGQIMDIPTDIRSTYCASLGHKACHSFQPSGFYGYTTHPRFGKIRCIIALHNLEPGQEVTTDYRYNIGKAPDWYINSLKHFLVKSREYSSEEAQLYIQQIISKLKKETPLNDSVTCYRDNS